MFNRLILLEEKLSLPVRAGLACARASPPGAENSRSKIILQRRLTPSAQSAIIAICALLTGCAHGPGPDDTVRNAYAWYLRTLKSGVNPLEQKTELKEFVTDGFLVSLDNLLPVLDANPFVERGSFDAKLSIQKVIQNNRAATVQIELSGHFSGRHTLNVYLTKVEDGWKIDDVKVVEA